MPVNKLRKFQTQVDVAAVEILEYMLEYRYCRQTAPENAKYINNILNYLYKTEEKMFPVKKEKK